MQKAKAMQAVPHTRLLEQVNMEKMEAFRHQIYYCDPYTEMHAEHVGELMAGLATQMGLNSEEITLAYLVGLVHDVGKISVPAKVLTKAGRLSDEEFAIMRQHAAAGEKLLLQVEGAQCVADIIRHHHERFDGRGYPDQMKGKEIPLYSRMLALCDTFDAMTTHRCYRSPVDIPSCLRELLRCRGGQFDPVLTDCFLTFLEERFGLVVVEEPKDSARAF